MNSKLNQKLALFRQGTKAIAKSPKKFTNSKGGWRCGSSFIPKKSRCFRDPVTGKKLKEPNTYSQYRRKRADALKRKAEGEPLNAKEQKYIDQTLSDRQRLLKRNQLAKTKAAVKSVGGSTILHGGIASIDPKKIKVDPKRFQYKLSGTNNKSGSVGSLSGVKKWDANLAGIIQVWADPKDKNVYVVNGHNRLQLEQKLGVEKRPARFLAAKSPKEARAIGAMTNIAEGRGNARDAAKFFRDSGITRKDLEKKGIPLKEKIATDGIALSNLSDGLFNSVIDGKLPESRAVVIGQKLKDHAQQEALVQLIAKEEKKGKRITNDVVSELADMTTTAPKKQEGANLLTLLGFDPEERSLAIEKASIAASIKRQLNKDKKLFGTVGKSSSAKELAKAGNKINIEESATISKNANTTAVLFEKKKFEAGKIDKVLNLSAERLANGEKREKIAKEAREEIEAYLQQTFKYGKEASPRRNKEEFNLSPKKIIKFNTRKTMIAKANFSTGYYYQTRNGKRVRVRKRRDNSKLIRSAELLGTAGGLTAGARLGAKLVDLAGRNGMIRRSAMAGGGLAGGAIALMLANRIEKRFNL